MSQEAIKAVPDGYKEDAQGNLVPVGKVKPEHDLEDEMVCRFVNSAIGLNGTLTAFKEAALDEVAAFRALIAEQYGATKGGRRGNVTLRSFDGRMEMQISVSDHLAFGPELQAAKDLIDECVMKWAQDTNDNIRVLINHAFQVNKQGRIDTSRVLSLRRLDISDPIWKRAMVSSGISSVW